MTKKIFYLLCLIFSIIVISGVLTYKLFFEPTATLLQAIEKGDTAKVRSLLQRGANVNMRGEARATPLHAAAYYGRGEIAELLISYGADINAADDNGNTPLLISHTTPGESNPIRVLLKHGVNPNQLDKEGYSELAFSTLRNDLDSVNALLDHGADSNWSKVDKPYLTLLVLAVYEKHTDLVRILLAHGADPNVTLPNGKTLLKVAKDNGDQKIVNLLQRAISRRPY